MNEITNLADLVAVCTVCNTQTAAVDLFPVGVPVIDWPMHCGEPMLVLNKTDRTGKPVLTTEDKD